MFAKTLDETKDEYVIISRFKFADFQMMKLLPLFPAESIMISFYLLRVLLCIMCTFMVYAFSRKYFFRQIAIIVIC